MKEQIEWFREEPRRLRMFLVLVSVFTFIVAGAFSFILAYFAINTEIILGIIGGEAIGIVASYLATKADTD